MNEAKLKACPWCGEMPGIDEGIVGPYIYCKNRKCRTACHSQGVTDKEAIEYWNDRAGDKQPQAAPNDGDIVSSLKRVVVLLNREELNLLCGAVERYADALAKNCEQYRAILSEQKDRPDARLLYAKVAVRCERDTRKQYERLKQLKSYAVKMQHNDKVSGQSGRGEASDSQ